jgi:DNA polymerase III gamma/tau subunit
MVLCKRREHMNLKSLTREQLHQSSINAVTDEREAITTTLLHLCEIECQKLYADYACSSLFDYCTSWLKMSEPMAASRINAARALREFPELKEKLDSGALTLTSVHQAQVSFKKEAKVKAHSKSKKREILARLENKSTREVEKLLFSESSIKAEVKESARMVSNELTEIRYGANTELMADLERLKEIWGISSLAELTAKMAKVCLKHCDPLKKAERARPATQAPESRSRYIPAPVRHFVWRRDKSCTFVDPETGKRCGSRYRLQLDHIIPFALDGENTAENLRLRCHAHNQLHAVDCFGPWVRDFAGARL